MNPADPPETDSAKRATETDPQPPWWKRTLKFLFFRVVFWYAVICLIVMFIQRHLIYHPTRVKEIPVSASRLGEGFVHSISFETPDGLTLNGWHLLRNGQKCETADQCQQALDSGKWLVLFFHGNGGDRRGRVSYSQILTGAKSDVFLIDYRGYADNPGSPNEEGLYDDARGLWKYATEERGVDPGRIVLFGESLGGGVAVRLAQEVCRAGSPPAGLIVRSTFSSLTDAAGHHYPWLPVRLLLWDRFPSEEAIGDVTCPLLMLHGTDDRIVPFDLGRKLFGAAPDESETAVPKQFVPLEGADHNRLLFTHRQEFTRAIEEFFAKLPETESQDSPPGE